MQLSRIYDLPKDFDRLETESLSEGYNFMTRMREEWVSGKNQFSMPNEFLYAAFDGSSLVGICGLNIDPYLPDNVVGRLRHLYVQRAARRKGVAKALVTAILQYNKFSSVRLRTRNPAADLFYCAMGFQKVNDDSNATHVWKSEFLKD